MFYDGTDYVELWKIGMKGLGKVVKKRVYIGVHRPC